MKIAKMSVELIDSMGSDLSVVNSARVSFSKESEWEYLEDTGCKCWARSEEECGCDEFERERKLPDKDIKLINYLAKHNHFTPFTHCFASFRIKVPIFVARQLHKHQVGLSVNEESRRYIDSEPEFYLPNSLRSRPENSIKQGSGPAIMPNILNELVHSASSRCLEWYEDLLAENVAPEQARVVLPQNTMTNFIWSGSLAAFARVCRLRLDAHAQKETGEVAQLINDHMIELFPHSWEALLTTGDK